MLDEYDFSKGVRGKCAGRYAKGTNVVVIAPDVAAVFPDADSVNDALRALLRIAPALSCCMLCCGGESNTRRSASTISST